MLDFSMYINVITTGDTSERSQYYVLKRNIRKERKSIIRGHKKQRAPVTLFSAELQEERMPYSEADTNNIQSDRKLIQRKVSCLAIRSELCLCVNTLEMLNFKMFTILRATCIISCRRISIKVSTKPRQFTTCSSYGDLHSSNQNKTINFVWKKMTLKVAKTEVKYYIGVLDSMIQE